ncbi:MAG: hypothetical protein VX293_10840 [Candidatus Latescibacterota bacterium]|nr:hypothetical protein [Candidatus Latescibacterota bacterium]
MAKAEEIEAIIRSLPITVIAVDLDLAREAARFKSAGGLSSADCFAAALRHHSTHSTSPAKRGQNRLAAPPSFA